MEHREFMETMASMVHERRKMTSPLYQTIMAGKATHRLLKNFVIHRYPIKNLWTRHLMGVGGRIDDYDLRREIVVNCYEEETGALTRSDRHVQTFIDFGESLGLTRDEIVDAEHLPETDELMAHNLRACNDTNVHFTEGTCSVLFLMEGQPPIANAAGQSMETVMRDVYGIPRKGHAFFTHHASSGGAEDHVSPLEDEHTETVRKVLDRYCTTSEMRRNALESLERSIELRHRHFDALMDRFYDPAEPVYRWQEASGTTIAA